MTGYTGYISKVGNHFYVPSLNGRKIYKINIDGTVSLFAGTGVAGNKNGTALNATFNAPSGIVGSPSGDTILITDGNRIRMITNLERTASTTMSSIVEALKLSLNPSSNIIHVSFDLTTASNLNWQIFNAQGQLMLQDSLKHLVAGKSQIQINIHQLPKGLYAFYIGGQNKASVQKAFLKID